MGLRRRPNSRPQLSASRSRDRAMATQGLWGSNVEASMAKPTFVALEQVGARDVQPFTVSKGPSESIIADEELLGADEAAAEEKDMYSFEIDPAQWQHLLVTEAFNLAYDILREGVRGISDVITVPGLVNVILPMSLGKSRARDAALNAIQSPVLDVGISEQQMKYYE